MTPILPSGGVTISATSILINIGAQTAGAVREVEKVNTALGHQMTAGEKLKSSWKKVAKAVAGAVAGAAVVDYFTEAAKAAAADAAEVEKLEKVVRNSTKATDDQIESLGGWIDSMQLATGIADSDLRTAVGRLVGTTGDLGEAQKAAAVAADLAAGRGISLSAATKQVEKALAGNTTALKKQYPQWDKNKDGILSSKEAMAGLSSTYEGAAEAAANPWEQVKIVFDELQESIGGFVLPILEKVSEWLKNPGNIDKLKDGLTNVADAAQRFGEKVIEAFQWLSENWSWIQPLAVALGAVAIAMGILNVVMAVATTVMTAWGIAVAIATSPITLIVLAIAAVIAIGVLLYKNWDTITAWLAKAWDWVKEKAVAVWGAIRDWFAETWNKIKDTATNVWNGIKEWFSKTWDSIKTKAVELFEGIKTAVSEKITAVITFARELPGKVVAAIGDVARTLWQKGIDLIQGFIEGYVGAYVAVGQFFAGLAGKIGSAIGNLGRSLYEKGRDLISGFINGIKSMAGRILDAILSILPGPVRGVIRGALGFSLAPGTGAGIGTYGARSGGGNTATINLYGSATPADARVIKRALEGYDVSQGRYAGAPLRVAW